MNILIVDDWEDIKDLLQRNLRGLPRPVKVEQVLDIPEAVSAVGRFQPDIVVLDIQLPSGSGLRLIQHIKHLLPDTKVIMFTGYADMNTERSARELGADYFFYKGDEYEKLVETVAELVATPQEATSSHPTGFRGQSPSAIEGR